MLHTNSSLLLLLCKNPMDPCCHFKFLPESTCLVCGHCVKLNNCLKSDDNPWNCKSNFSKMQLSIVWWVWMQFKIVLENIFVGIEHERASCFTPHSTKIVVVLLSTRDNLILFRVNTKIPPSCSICRCMWWGLYQLIALHVVRSMFLIVLNEDTEHFVRLFDTLTENSI